MGARGKAGTSLRPRGTQPASRARRRRLALLLLVLATVAGLLSVASPAHAEMTFTVNSAADDDDGTCLPDPGDCTLREAINAANATPGADTIEFSIATGPVTISVTSDLPAITDPVTVDGKTQDGFDGDPLVTIAAAPSQVHRGLGIASQASPSTIRGLVVRGFNETGIVVASNNNVIGGTDVADRNVVSNNQVGIYILGNDNQVLSNYVGTDVSGMSRLGNGYGILVNGRQNAVGKPGSGNVVSGNGDGAPGGLPGYGIWIAGGSDPPRNPGDANSIQGNYVGTSSNGTAPLGNDLTGILLTNEADRNVIGGGAGNTVAFNGDRGIVLRPQDGVFPTGNTIRFNSIFSNSGLGIDLEGVFSNDQGDPDSGANNGQNYPVLTEASNGSNGLTIRGTLNSTPLANFRIEFYLSQACDPSGFGEGEAGFSDIEVTTDSAGNASFSPTFDTTVADNYVFTATASRRDAATNEEETSEFSPCQQVSAAPATPPAPPTGVTAGAGDAQAEVSWIAPDSTGSGALASYTVDSSPDSPGTPVTVPASQTTTTISGLTNGTSYTFTVTATNEDNQTSGASDPSNSVTPEEGAAPPESNTDEVPAGGSLSTGSSATASDPTNTSIQTPNRGTVSIGEGAMTGTPPPGVQYFGQQIDITAPDAAADNPMTFTFVTDCSALPSDITTCADARAASVSRESFAAETATSPAEQVAVTDYAYTPRTVTVDQGQYVQWSFKGAHRHSVTDSRGLGPSGAALFNSGSKPAGTTYAYQFTAAGGYPYRSTVAGDPSTMTGNVRVPLQLSQSGGNPRTTIIITWASVRRSGYRFDAQYRFKAPNATTFGRWVDWRRNTTLGAGQLIAEELRGEGTYQFRARLENSSTLRTSWWSLPATVTITPENGPSRLSSLAMFHEDESGNNRQLPDCTGPAGVAQPAPSCVWSETIRPDGDLEVVIYTTRNGRWRGGRILG